MAPVRTTYLTYVLILIAITFISCSDTTGPGNDTGKTVQLTVFVKDTSGTPVNGITLVTTPETITRITDENGSAVFDELARGSYQIVARLNGVDIFTQNLILKDEPVIVNFTIAAEVTVNLSVKHAQGIPLDGVIITTSPPTSTVTYTEGDTTVLENVPVKPYTFIIRRGSVNAYIINKVISIRDGKVQDLELTIEPQQPYVSITNIQNKYRHTIYDLYFEAEGLDFEDGVLPSEAFSWYSDIDGFLGNGNTIHVDQMSVGHHQITVRAIDSNMLENTSTRTIILSFYSKNSYFPIPEDGFWTYSNTPAQASIMNERGVLETFYFHDIESSMEDVNERTSTMMYYKDSGDWYRYTVTDFYDNDGDAFYVTRTIETIEGWYDEPHGDTADNMVTIITTYGEKYPLFENHLDLSSGADFAFSTEAEVDWLFEGIAYGSQHFIEQLSISSITSFEGYETIATNAGILDAAKLRIVQGDTERYWWLAKGYGIVQYTYNTFNIPVTSLMTGTNLGDLQKTLPPAPKQTSTNASDQYLIPVESPSDTVTALSDSIYNTIRLLRSMVPR